MNHSKIISLALCTLLTVTSADAVRKVKVKTPVDPYKTLKDKIDRYFVNFKTEGQRIRATFHLKTLVVDDSLRTIDVQANNSLGEQLFTNEMAETIYQGIQRLLPDSCQDYDLTVKTGGWDLRQLVPNRLQHHKDKKRTWGHTDYHGRPWVANASRPYEITEGLQGRHLSVWASHGRYFHVKDSVWKWQRPSLFGTREDLFTPTIVTPYLIPMLQNAGAVVFTPRERDWQRNEYIVDNDQPESGYNETNGLYRWEPSDSTGFTYHTGAYTDFENPFIAGSARQASTVDNYKRQSEIVWNPTITEAGNYAVYVSYQTVEKSIDDAHYTVWHQGVPTTFRVNQQMGGKTWVYLGTFYFDEGKSTRNCVTLSNVSRHHHGVVTADAVRFGGGMGNIDRGRGTSGLPRCMEGARYYAQWAGMPYEVYSTKDGQDDYGDDINVRSYMTNLLAGGSVFAPDTTGLNVPIELALAIHSDAGYTKDGKTHTGTLSICTTYLNDSILKTGLTRLASRDLADELLHDVTADINKKYDSWPTRELYDRNYSETRCPMMPSAILETMSHQNFADMRLGQDPHFRFDLARSIYKALLRYVCAMHHKKYVVQPLAPNRVRAELTGKGEAKISWHPVYDPYEATAKPTGYVVYTAKGRNGFDNGTYVKGSETSLTIPVERETVYAFRVTAVNEGGESFPTEVVSVFDVPEAQKTVLVVNGFQRLASPAVVDNAVSQGFDLEEDAGVSYGRTAGWLGYQKGWDKAKMGSERTDGLGYTNDSLMGQFIAGNDFDYIRTHTQAIATARQYRVVSCSSEAIDHNDLQPQQYELMDVILGLQREDGYATVPYQVLSPIMREQIGAFAKKGGALLVSGAYLGSDMQEPADRRYLEDILKLKYQGRNLDSLQRDSIRGLGLAFTFYRHLNERHYATLHPEILEPVYPAFSAMKYADDYSACVAYNGNDYKAITLGFPFECIKDEPKRNSIMRGLLQFLLQSQ